MITNERRQQFDRALAALQPGEAIIYHTGYLVNDRDRNTIAQDFGYAAWKAHEDGRARLYQKRLGPGAWNYIAVRA